MTTQSLRNWYLVHKWTSLISTLFLLMLCLTGLPLIFHHEIEHALGNAVEPPVLPGVNTVASLDSIVNDARALRPDDVVQYLFRDPDEPEAWHITMAETIQADEGSAFFMFDARTGELLHEAPVNEGFMYVMFRLHLDMFAGLSGTLFLGAMGLLLAASLVSGVVVYKPFMSRLTFGTVRTHKSARVKWLDLHNVLGITTLVWVMVVGVTGVINTLAIPIFGLWQTTELQTMAAVEVPATPIERSIMQSTETPSIERALAAAKQAAPDTDLSFVAFPGNQFTTEEHFGFFMMGNTPLTAQLLTPILVNARTSEVTYVGTMPWYVSTLLLSQPLHFGDYGGLPLKILWAILDIIAILVLGSGVYLWLKKSRKRDEPFSANNMTEAVTP